MFGLVTYSLLMLLLVVGTLRRPALAYAGVLCLYGLKQWGQNSSAWLVQNRVVTNFAVALLVAISIVLLAARGKAAFNSKIPANWKLVLLLYAYAFVTLLSAPDFDTSLQQWVTQGPYILTIMLLAPMVLNSVDDVRHAMIGTAVIGGATCGLALFAGQWGYRGLLVLGDIYVQETNPLAIASLAGTVCLIALLGTQGSQPLWRKTVMAALVLIGIAVMLRSGSRGQLGAAAFAAVIGWPLASSKGVSTRLLSLLVIGLLLGIAGVWVWDQLGVYTARWSATQSTADVEGRFAMATTLLNQATRSPATLVLGLGNSSSYYYLGIYPHITALEVLAEEGLIGVSLYLAALIATAAYAVRLLRLTVSSIASNDRTIVATVISLFLFELILSMKQGSLLSSTYVFAYATVIAKMTHWQSSAQLEHQEVSDCSMLKQSVIPANLMQ